MKPKKIIILERILKYFAVKALNRYQPRIVGVTGSVGKTSTKEAIFSVLSEKFQVRKNEKNYNNEIGIPLTVLGLESGGGNFWKWIAIGWQAFLVTFFGNRKKYPDVLVLELGADRPGDIKYLVDFLKPEVGVMTSIGISHLEHFRDRKSIAREKGYLAKNLKKGGVAILNVDDDEIQKIAQSLMTEMVSFGFSEGSDLRASDIFFGYEKTKDQEGIDLAKIRGVSFKLSFEGVTLPVRLLHSVGRPQIYAVLAAAGVGIHFGMNLVEIAQAVRNFQPPVGRLNLLEGVKNTMIIEDSYNAAPQSTLAALEVLEKINARRKIAALGDMLELGEETENGHQEVGRKVAEVVDVLFAVGEMGKIIADEAEKQGLDKSNIFSYKNSAEAKIPIQNMLKEGDIILIKGSQGARMERISEEIMRNPKDVEKLLPRQSAEWK